MRYLPHFNDTLHAVFGSYRKISYIRIQFKLIEKILIFNAHIGPNHQIHKTSTREGLIKNRLTRQTNWFHQEGPNKKYLILPKTHMWYLVDAV